MSYVLKIHKVNVLPLHQSTLVKAWVSHIKGDITKEQLGRMFNRSRYSLGCLKTAKPSFFFTRLALYLESNGDRGIVTDRLIELGYLEYEN